MKPQNIRITIQFGQVEVDRQMAATLLTNGSEAFVLLLTDRKVSLLPFSSVAAKYARSVQSGLYYNVWMWRGGGALTASLVYERNGIP